MIHLFTYECMKVKSTESTSPY